MLYEVITLRSSTEGDRRPRTACFRCTLVESLNARPHERHLHNFRQELAEGGGLSSYPHPYLMPEFWQFPTVSMGLGPIMSIYQARFNRYLKARGLVSGDEPNVWCYVA